MLLCGVVMLAAGTSGCATVVHKGRVDNKSLDEISGLARSARGAGVVWVVNDSGNDAAIYALATGGDGEAGRAEMGRHVATLRLTGIDNRDWEDLASVTISGEPWLVVADMGDNNAKRDVVRLVFVREPRLPARATPQAAEPTVDVEPLALDALPSLVLPFGYEDGPRDAEGLAIDPASGDLLILSKRVNPPGLYRLPWPGALLNQPPPHRADTPDPTDTPRVAETATAHRIATLRGGSTFPEADEFDRMPIFQQPTAMDISPDGRCLLVLTYPKLWLYERPTAHAPWAQVVAAPPAAFTIPPLPQSEACAFAGPVFATQPAQPPDQPGNPRSHPRQRGEATRAIDAWLTTEGKRPPLFRLRLPLTDTGTRE